MTVKNENTMELVAFELSDRSFCIDTKKVREIRGFVEPTSIPNSPECLLGVINLRGSVIPVVDMGIKLLRKAIQPNTRSAIIVAESEGAPVGLLVDSVTDMMAIPREEMQKPPEMSICDETRAICGVFPNGETLICHVEIDELLDRSDGLSDFETSV